MEGDEKSGEQGVAAWGDEVGRSAAEWCALLPTFRPFTGFPRELDAIVAQFAHPRRAVVSEVKVVMGRKSVGRHVYSPCLVGSKVFFGTKNGLRVLDLKESQFRALSKSLVSHVCYNQETHEVVAVNRNLNSCTLHRFDVSTGWQVEGGVRFVSGAIGHILAIACDDRSRVFMMATNTLPHKDEAAEFNLYDLKSGARTHVPDIQIASSMQHKMMFNPWRRAMYLFDAEEKCLTTISCDAEEGPVSTLLYQFASPTEEIETVALLGANRLLVSATTGVVKAEVASISIDDPTDRQLVAQLWKFEGTRAWTNSTMLATDPLNLEMCIMAGRRWRLDHRSELSDCSRPTFHTIT